jgi:hypothetical protein
MKAADFGTKADLQNGEHPVSERPCPFNVPEAFCGVMILKFDSKLC